MGETRVRTLSEPANAMPWVHLKINWNRAVKGIILGLDPFMNIVLDETIEFTKVRRKLYV